MLASLESPDFGLKPPALYAANCVDEVQSVIAYCATSKRRAPPRNSMIGFCCEALYSLFWSHVKESSKIKPFEPWATGVGLMTASLPYLRMRPGRMKGVGGWGVEGDLKST